MRKKILLTLTALFLLVSLAVVAVSIRDRNSAIESPLTESDSVSTSGNLDVPRLKSLQGEWAEQQLAKLGASQKEAEAEAAKFIRDLPEEGWENTMDSLNDLKLINEDMTREQSP